MIGLWLNGAAPRRPHCVSCLLLCLLLATGAWAKLPETVSRTLSRQKIPARAVSVVVRAVDTDAPLLSYRSEAPRNPASVIKVLTTYAALEILGPGYVWPTEAYIDGTLTDGQLNGNLVLKGYGDPYFVTEAFWRFLRGLRDRGLNTVKGNLILDDSYFEQPQGEPGDFDGKPHRVYNAQPNALSLNFQATAIRMVPEPANGRVRVFLEPPLANFALDNRLRLVNGRCTWQHYYPKAQFTPIGKGARIVLEGDFSVRCREGTLNRMVTTPPEHLFGAFIQLWADGGGGFFRLTAGGPEAAGSQPVSSRRVAPVGRQHPRHEQVQQQSDDPPAAADHRGPSGGVRPARRRRAEQQSRSGWHEPVSKRGSWSLTTGPVFPARLGSPRRAWRESCDGRGRARSCRSLPRRLPFLAWTAPFPGASPSPP